MKIQTILLGLLISLLISSPGGAQVYKWVDENGVTRYSDSPPPEGVENYETESEIAYDEAADKARTEEDKQAAEVYSQQKAQEEQQEKQAEEAKAQEAEAGSWPRNGRTWRRNSKTISDLKHSGNVTPNAPDVTR